MLILHLFCTKLFCNFTDWFIDSIIISLASYFKNVIIFVVDSVMEVIKFKIEPNDLNEVCNNYEYEE